MTTTGAEPVRVRLTEKMREALVALSDGPRSAYPGLSLGSLKALANRELAVSRHNPGSGFFPQTAIVWTLTTAGRAALAQEIQDGR